MTMSAANVTSFAASLADLGLTADENPLAPLFSQLRNLNASLFMTVAGVALFMYDWLIMFDDEWQHIWYGGRINSVKLLYILNRILTPAILAVDLYDKGGLAKNLTQETCRWALNFDGWGTIISYGSIHWIVTLRVWTVYGRSRRLLAVFAITFLAYFVATSYIWAKGSAEISKTIFPSPVVVKICYTVIPEWLWWLWVPNIVYECIIFFATLWKAWEHHQANLNTPILAVLYRDGFIYFFVICLLSLANMFTWLWAPHSLAILFKYFSLAAVNVAASRLVLDLRTVGQANRTTINAGTVASRPNVAKRASHPLHVSLDRQLQDVEMSPRYQGYADLSNGPGQLYRNPSSHGHGQHGTTIPEGRSVFVEDDPEILEGWEVVQRQEATHSRSLSSATATAFSPRSGQGHVHSPSTHSHRAYGQVPMSAGGASNPRSPFSPQETDRFYTPTSPASASIGMRALSPASPRSPTGGSRIPPELIAAIDFGPPDEPTPKAQKRFSQRKPAPPALGLGLEPPPRRNPGRHPYAPPNDSPSASDYSPSMASFSNSIHSTNPPQVLGGSFVPRMSISGSLRSYDPEAADAIERDAAALERDGRHGSFQGTPLRPYRESAGSASVYSQQDGAPNPYRASNVSHATTFGRSHQTHGTQTAWSEEGGGAGAQYGRQQR